MSFIRGSGAIENRSYKVFFDFTFSRFHLNQTNGSMNLEQLTSSLDNDTPPSELSTPLQALWYDACGNWDRAHELAQDHGGSVGAWVHAYLHRKEGDKSNASYWYNRAGKEMPDHDLETEWNRIAEELLSRS